MKKLFYFFLLTAAVIFKANTTPVQMIPAEPMSVTDPPSVDPPSYTGTLCAGASFNVPYILHGTFDPGNVVTLLLYGVPYGIDPLPIGSVSSTVSGTITGVIPTDPGIIQCRNYRLGLSTSSPGVTSATGGSVNVATSAPSGIITATPGTTGCGSVALSAGSNCYFTTYQWALNGTNYSTFNQISTTTSGSYVCTMSNACGTVVSNTLSVTVNPVPPVPVISPSSPVFTCAGPVNVSVNAVNGLSYQWYKSGTGIIPGAIDPSYDATTSGYYYAAATNSFNCSSNSAYASLNIGPPVASITPAGAVPICRGRNVTVNLYAYPNDIFHSYQWYRNGTLIAGATTSAYSTHVEGSYTVRVSLISGGCSGTSPATTVNKAHCKTDEDEEISEIQDIGSKPQSVNIYPNPASNSATIRLSSLTEANLQIVNALGQLLYAQKLNEQETLIDLSKFSEGVYIARWSNGENSGTKMFMVEK